jgi:hypothetical protein
MTRIQLIAGLPANEFADRGREIKVDYIPFNSLTKGELDLYILRNQAKAYSQAFPEKKEYAQATQMLSNALHAGVHNGINFTGAMYDPILQDVARQIRNSKYNGTPATGLMLNRENIFTSAIGDLIITSKVEANCEDYATRLMNDYLHSKVRIKLSRKKWKALKSLRWTPLGGLSAEVLYKKWQEKVQECQIIKNTELLVNDMIIDGSHHIVYKGLGSTNADLPQDVKTKTILHGGSLQTISNIAGFDRATCDKWVSSAIKTKNLSNGTAPWSPDASAFLLSQDPEAYITKYANRDALIYNTYVEKKQSGVNVLPPVAVQAIIIAAIGAASTIAVKFIEGLFKMQNANASALSNSGFGTPDFSAKTKDWKAKPTTSSSSGNSNLLTYGLLAAGAYVILNNE